jgi:hypothetical protein
MSHETRDNFIASPYDTQTTARPAEFAGFRPPTSNTTYTPNQFFDAVMPVASRGCLRIVGYLIRKTLGWCDADGNPQEEQIQVSYSELERKAGVGHSMIRAALDEALAGHFVECVQAGKAKASGDNGQAAFYSLKWDATAEYVREAGRFRGFYEGEGNRTDIPNQFFDHILPNERAAVIAVVGAVIRYSIGFQAKHGARRQQATLSYTQILKASGITSRRALAGAIREAITKNYIVRIDPGYFSAEIAERRSATYAIRWTDGFSEKETAITPKRIPDELWKNHSEKATSGTAERSEMGTKNTPKRLPADHSEKENIETKPLNEKQKQTADLLKKEGFEAKTAAELVSKHPLEVIHRQLAWIGFRNATKSRAGLLRRAIEGDWPRPHPPSRAEKPNIDEAEDGPREEYHRAHEPAYFRWLTAEEEACRASYPAEYERFQAKRNRAREDIYQDRSAKVRVTLLAFHDDPRTRLLDFQRFLGLPDFWQWDAHINKQPFNPQS